MFEPRERDPMAILKPFGPKNWGLDDGGNNQI